MTLAAARHGAAAYFSDLEHEKQFRRLMRGRYRDLSVVGVACIWMLASGMRAAEAAGVPSQGVLLNYCGCEHWRDDPVVTDAVVERVEAILAAKAADSVQAPQPRRAPSAWVALRRRGAMRGTAASAVPARLSHLLPPS
jgi:hypothetical protein